jgi:hypothetical protein
MDWAVYFQSELPEALHKVEELKKAVDEEREPYKSKYAGADLLEKVANELQTYIDDRNPEHGELQALNALKIKVLCERGLLLLDTDLAEQGEPLVLDSLQSSWSIDIPNCILKQRAYNGLGALYCSRSQFEKSQEQLEAAVSAYKAGKELQDLQQQQQQQKDVEQEDEQQHGTCTNPSTTSASPDSKAGEGHSAASSSHAIPAWPTSDSSDQAAAAEAHYTTSLYYLAQVHGLAGNKDESAMYCAATLNRQVHGGG